DFAFENGFGRFDALTSEILALGDYSDADLFIVLRNVPEPPLLRHIGHGSSAFIDAGIAFGAFVIGPDRYFVELRISDAPIVAHGGEGLLAGAIERDWGAKLL